MSRLPELPYVVVDTNQLRSDTLVRELLVRFDKTGERVMLPWTAAHELSKGGGDAFSASMRVLCERPESVAVAKPSMVIYQETERRFCAQAKDVTWKDSTEGLRQVLLGMREGFVTRDELRTAAFEGSADTRTRLEEMRFDALFRSGVEGVRRSLTRKELNDIRTALQQGDREPLRQVLTESFTQQTLPGFLERVSVPPSKARRLARFPSFVALQFIANIAVSLRWGVLGGIESTKQPLENDGVDVENVIIALYGREFHTRDRNARGVYEDLLAVTPRIWP